MDFIRGIQETFSRSKAIDFVIREFGLSDDTSNVYMFCLKKRFRLLDVRRVIRNSAFLLLDHIFSEHFV